MKTAGGKGGKGNAKSLKTLGGKVGGKGGKPTCKPLKTLAENAGGSPPPIPPPARIRAHARGARGAAMRLKENWTCDR